MRVFIELYILMLICIRVHVIAC